MTRSIVRPTLAAALVAGSFLVAGHASAQVVYEPVRYQYGTGSNTYYYGGSNPRLFDFADASPAFDPRRDVARSVPVVARQVVYSDGTGYRDAAGYGYTPNDARNEAYDNVPRYFRKADLRLLATPTRGGWVVPAQAEPRETTGVRRSLPIPEPTPPGTILIIPKKLLDEQPAPSVVMAK